MCNISIVPRRHGETPSIQPWVQDGVRAAAGGGSVKDQGDWVYPDLDDDLLGYRMHVLEQSSERLTVSGWP